MVQYSNDSNNDRIEGRSNVSRGHVDDTVSKGSELEIVSG